ncbi:MAG TPA: hypothetical protein VMR41_01715 [Patescibacteria group bacterium]|nr:hypothetical protein [Patescibacteria group bacterium]
MQYPLLPLVLLKFWYVDAPLGLMAYFSSLNQSFLRLFSLSLLVRTFFQPIKSEYRQGLVGFSIGMGIAVKSVIILVTILIWLALISLEVLFLFSFIMLPLFSIMLFFLNL